MSLFVLPFPAFDPVALEIGPVAIRWYGLAYMTGLLLGWLYLKRLLTNRPLWDREPALNADQADSMLLWATFGVVIGGRLGFVLFYEPSFFIENPSEVFAVWRGGMAFHGALVGSMLAFFMFARLNNIGFFSVTDLASAVVPIGLFFGRLANFINAEVVGRVSDVPWAMVFPGAGPATRHPSQLYEAALEGIVLFLVLRHFTHNRRSLRWPGMTSGVFLLGYGIARSVGEIFRQYDPNHYFNLGPYATTGMLYSLPMILFGLYLVRTSRFRAESKALSDG